ncbi:hypothetical protein ACLSZY_10795 [Avibacterium volantium]
MIEVIDKSDKARTFAYVVLILGFIFAMSWLVPNLLTSIAEFILTLRNS